jgi:CBS domain containing-hemolysin-like protein
VRAGEPLSEALRVMSDGRLGMAVVVSESGGL